MCLIIVNRTGVIFYRRERALDYETITTNSPETTPLPQSKLVLSLAKPRRYSKAKSKTHPGTIILQKTNRSRVAGRRIGRTPQSGGHPNRADIPIVDTDTLALTIIELFNDARVEAKLEKVTYPQELDEQVELR